MSSGPDVVVIGVGNLLRGDDAAGLLVARRIRERAREIEVREHEGDPSTLIDALGGRQTAILVDAIHSGGRPGGHHRFDASAKPLPARVRGSSSTHAVSLAEALELARAVGRLPKRVIVHGIEGGFFEAGSGLSPEVAAAIDAVADEVLADARQT